ncbi:MAG: autotransporter-associated beta strand repeat-containing protein [Tepidisphaeraceae bacterium]|jgi:autotransporter-associated beta strand protein
MKSWRAFYCATSFALLPLGQAWCQVYYVSPTGSDSNSGTSPSSPWQTLSKVDSTTFAPGSQILFQAGGNWYGQQLSPSSSGTPSDPITYGSYGNGANPTFWGSVIVPASSFEPVAGEPNTYFYPTTTTVNAFLVNHQFTHDASLVSNQTSDAGNISYVESTPNSNYYDPDGATPGLYVNTGGSITSNNVYTTAILQNVVSDVGQNNLVFKNLTVQESAEYNGGYGYLFLNSSNVQLLNSTVIAAGKHGVGAINSTGFLGENLTASYLMPDQGYGGATAFVSYADSTVSNTNSQWINDTFTNPNGSYQAFITHNTPNSTNPTPIASVLVQNLVTDADPAITIYTSGSEQVNIIGGQMSGGVQLGGNNTTLNGALLTGADAEIDVDIGGTGTGNVVENTIISGTTPNWEAGHAGAIVDYGQGNIIRFNTIVLGKSTGPYGAAIGLASNTTNTQIYGNIIDSPSAAFFQSVAGTPSINAFDNLFAGTSDPQVIFAYNQSPNAPIADWPTTISANELYGDPSFADAADGNFTLQPNSIAAYVFDPTTDEYVMSDYYSNVRPNVLASLGAIQETAPSLTWTNASNNGLWDAGASPNWNNGAGAAVYTDQSTVLFDDSNGGNYAVTLNTMVTPGRVVVDDSAGNYTISGTGGIAGTGSLAKFGNGTLTLRTANTYSGGTVVYAGTLLIAPTSTPAINSALATGSVSITGGTLQLAPNVTLGSGTITSSVNITSLSIIGNGVLDVNNNHIIITYGSSDPIAAIAGYIKSGYNGGGWNGPGIISTAALTKTNGLSYGVGYADGKDGKVSGLVSGQIEVAYTLLGDANLDGEVNAADFTILAANFNQSITGWDLGDFNYDGIVNAADFTDLAANFNQGDSGAASAGDVAALDAFAAANGLLVDVPEPATGSLLLVAGTSLLIRRRRKHLA